MRRKLSLLIAFVGVLGLVGFAPVAQADHAGTTDHDAQPSAPTPFPGGECAVLGEVSINVGVDTTPRHNHYKFNDTVITCAAGTLPAGFTGQFNVQAAGGTDGEEVVDGDESGALEHGETDANGWSHKSCYVGGCEGQNAKGDDVSDLYDGTHDQDPNTAGVQCWNCGEITVEHTDGVPTSTDTHNVVMFDRLGSTVVAWGELHPDQVGNPTVCFLAELEFAPNNPDPNDPTKPVDRAALTGNAQIWDEANSPCGVDQGNKK